MGKKKANKKMMKKVCFFASIALFVVGALLLVLSIASPAGKTFTYKNEDGDKVSFVFTKEELKMNDSESGLPWELGKNDEGQSIVRAGVKSSLITVMPEVCEYHGLYLLAGDYKYTSAGAVIMFVSGIILMVAGAAGVALPLIKKH